MNEDLPLIDNDEARALFASQAMGDAEFYRELVDTQEAETGRLLGELREALASGDFALLRRIAHTFKGAGATFGLPRLKAAGLEIESASREAMPANAAESAAALESVARDSLGVLRDFARTL